MSIQVHNLRDLKRGPIPSGDARIDRKSYLGNPFDIGKNEALRLPICVAHRDYTERVIAGEEPVAVATEIANERNLKLASAWKQPTRAQFMKALEELKNKAQQAQQAGKDFGIWCWCAPKQCHGDTYKNILEQRKLRI
jgi:hypothetical protein